MKTVIFHCGCYGHPDQQPHILVWQDLCENPPEWLRPFLPPTTPGPATLLPVKAQSSPPGLYPPLPPLVLPESQTDLIQFDLETLPPPLYAPAPPAPPPPPVTSAQAQPTSPESPLDDDDRPAHGTRGARSKRAQSPQDVAVTLPLWPYGPMMDNSHGGEMPTL